MPSQVHLPVQFLPVFSSHHAWHLMNTEQTGRWLLDCQWKPGHYHAFFNPLTQAGLFPKNGNLTYCTVHVPDVYFWSLSTVTVYCPTVYSNLVCNAATNIPFYFEAISSIFFLGMHTNQNVDSFWTRKTHHTSGRFFLPFLLSFFSHFILWFCWLSESPLFTLEKFPPKCWGKSVKDCQMVVKLGHSFLLFWRKVILCVIRWPNSTVGTRLGMLC